MPSLGGATEGLNSEPLGPAELRGRAVLVNFWTRTCINWLRQEPYVRAWSRAYRDDGLVSSPVRGLSGSFANDQVRSSVSQTALAGGSRHRGSSSLRASGSSVLTDAVPPAQERPACPSG